MVVTNPRAQRRLSNVFLGVVRVLAVTFVATLLAFCIGLFFGIVGIVLYKMVRGTATPSMAVAYRHVAFPLALAALAITFVLALRSEIRHYRSMRNRQRLAATRTRIA